MRVAGSRVFKASHNDATASHPKQTPTNAPLLVLRFRLSQMRMQQMTESTQVRRRKRGRAMSAFAEEGRMGLRDFEHDAKKGDAPPLPVAVFFRELRPLLEHL